MGGQAEAISNLLKEEHRDTLGLAEALALAVKALGSVGGENGAPRQIADKQLEVAVLDRNRPGRAFRRITGNALVALLGTAAAEPAARLTRLLPEPPPPSRPPPEAAAEPAAPEPAAESDAPPSTPPAKLTSRPKPEPPREHPGRRVTLCGLGQA